MHAKILIDMLDTTISLLGPDFELLTEILFDLGVKHKGYGVKPEVFGPMGDALLFMLESSLGDDFSTAARHAWREIYAEISSAMVEVAQ